MTGSIQAPETEPSEPTSGFRATIVLDLPRDRLSIPVTRHLARFALEEVGVVEEDADAVELAVDEACANVVQHSGPGDSYRVTLTVGPVYAEIRVVDAGRGFDFRILESAMASLDAEHGRGVALMHALVDHVLFESRPEEGTVVHLVKTLRFDDGAPARKLMRSESRADSTAG